MLFYVLETHLTDAALGLHWFEGAQASVRTLHERLSGERESGRARGPNDVPPEYENREPILHAHTVLFAMDGISKTLGKLALNPLSTSATGAALVEFREALPNLLEVRNSAHHLEDRSRGLDRAGNPIELRPLVDGPFDAPGGALMLGNLLNDALVYTLNDGRAGRLEISRETVEVGRQAIQATIDSFTWIGSGRDSPPT